MSRIARTPTQHTQPTQADTPSTSYLQQLLILIDRAKSERHNPPKTRTDASLVCRTTLDLMLPVYAMDPDPRVRELAHKAWQKSRKLGKQALLRLAGYLEEKKR